MNDKIRKSDEEWRSEHSNEQFHVCRRKGTERAFTGKFYETKTGGTYRCVCCGEPLFRSDHKYDSGSGWPSFYQALNESAVEAGEDNSHGMIRKEVHCRKCGSHLGHLFPDGPQPTGMRYCINSVSLDLEPDADQ